MYWNISKKWSSVALKGYLSVGVILLCETLGSVVFAQDDTSHIEEGKKKESLKYLLEQGRLDINLRSFTMGTVTREQFQDSWNWAFSGRVGYHSGEWHGLSFGIGGSFIMRLASSDLNAKDPLTGRRPRFERQLLDLHDPNNHDIGGVEELFLQYRFHNSKVWFGRFHANSPLVNPHDGRMRPNALGGIWFDIDEIKHVHFGLGYFMESSPRSTNVWEKMDDVIGLFGTGFTVTGEKSEYAGNLNTHGLGLFEMKYRPNEHWTIGVWDYFMENIMNTAMLQVDYTSENWVAGLQYLHQDRVGNGGNENVLMAYAEPNHMADVISAKGKYKNEQFAVGLSYAYALPTGRYMFPREFGYDYIYTNTSRFRLEGFGKAHMTTIELQYTPKQVEHLKIKAQVAAILHNVTNDHRFNKYNAPQMGQLNAIASYKFKGFIEGLKAKFMYVYNFALEDVSMDPKLEYGITNFHQFNLILNYDLKVQRQDNKLVHH